MRDDSTLTAEPALAFAPGSPACAVRASLWTRQRVAILGLAYVGALAAMVLVRGVHISSDRYFLILLVPALVLGLARPYLRDWAPFVGLMIAYEFARGAAQSLNVEVFERGPYYAPMIDLERLLFAGAMPPTVLQDWLWSGEVGTFDWMIGSFNKVHFFVPPTLLFLIWLERRSHFVRCATAIVLASFIGAAIFLLFPAAPPWLAAQHGLIDVVHINSLQDAANGLPKGSSLIASQIPRNPVAAVPSLHAAYALLTVLIALSWRRRVGLALLPYPILMWFSIVYLGDHYVVDILAGVAVALVGWLLAGRLVRPGAPLHRLVLAGAAAPLRLARPFGGPT